MPKTPPTGPATPTVTPVRLAEIDASDDTFRQRALLGLGDLIAELRADRQRMPIYLRRRRDTRYQIIAGFRRVHALKELGRETADAIVVACDDAEAWRIAWAENAGHRRPQGVDLTYLVFKLHDEGRNHDEIGELCGMTARDRARVAAIGAMPAEVRALVRAHGLSLRHGAILAAFVARNPRTDVRATVAAAAERGLNEQHFADALGAAAKRRGRKPLGVQFRDKHRVAIDMARADPASWSEPVRKRLRQLHAWLGQMLEPPAR